MNIYYLSAGCLSLLLGIVHSILGEVLIFKNKRKNGSIISTICNENLKQKHLRIICATWHLASLFGFASAIILIKIAMDPIKNEVIHSSFIAATISIVMFLSAALVLIATKRKYPGWIVLLIIAVLLILGN